MAPCYLGSFWLAVTGWNSRPSGSNLAFCFFLVGLVVGFHTFSPQVELLADLRRARYKELSLDFFFLGAQVIQGGLLFEFSLGFQVRRATNKVTVAVKLLSVGLST